jgi:hypothetical protein
MQRWRSHDSPSYTAVANGAAWSQDATFNLMAKAAVPNAMTQSVNVVLGLQAKFTWAAVAASSLAAPMAPAGTGQAAGSAAGQAIGPGTGALVGRTVEGLTRQVLVNQDTPSCQAVPVHSSSGAVAIWLEASPYR